MMDEARFRAFYQEMYPRIWSYVHRMVMDGAECDDLVQDSFLRFLRSAPSRLDEANQRSYLYRIATNLVKDRWRSRKLRDEWLTDQGGAENVSAREDAVDASLDVNRAMEMLSPGQRSLVWLAYVEGYEHRESRRLRVSNPAVCAYY